MNNASGMVEGSPLTLTLSPEYRGEGIIPRWHLARKIAEPGLGLMVEKIGISDDSATIAPWSGPNPNRIQIRV